MNPMKLLQMGWQWLSPKMPDSNNLLNKAMEIGKHQNSPAAVIEMLETYARSKGLDGAITNNQLWNSFKTRGPQEIIPHAQKLLQESGKLPNILKIIGFGGNKNA